MAVICQMPSVGVFGLPTQSGPANKKSKCGQEKRKHHFFIQLFVQISLVIFLEKCSKKCQMFSKCSVAQCGQEKRKHYLSIQLLAQISLVIFLEKYSKECQFSKCSVVQRGLVHEMFQLLRGRKGMEITPGLFKLFQYPDSYSTLSFSFCTLILTQRCETKNTANIF